VCGRSKSGPFWGIAPPSAGYLAVLPALMVPGLMLGAPGLVLSPFVRQLESLAGVMNFARFLAIAIHAYDPAHRFTRRALAE
jgi:hypothetical protein